MSFHQTDLDLHRNFGARPVPVEAVQAAPKSRQGLYRAHFKRLFECGLVLGTGLVTLPVVLVLALMVALEGGSPFYSQTRIGMNGRKFRIWKLRTMVRNAEEELARYLSENPEARDEWNAHQKLKSDPRITRVGALLRKTSMDELPQLINVLNGTMSLVGPRPMMVDQQDKYNGRSYYRLRPGITGLWQISERNDSEFVARVRYDDEYDRNVSLSQDLSILARTVTVVLRGTGY